MRELGTIEVDFLPGEPRLYAELVMPMTLI